MIPLAGPRGFTGPIGVSNGSLRPNEVASASVRSLLAGFSRSIETFTASAIRAESIPTLSGFLCSHPNRSGKYADTSPRDAGCGDAGRPADDGMAAIATTMPNAATAGTRMA